MSKPILCLDFDGVLHSYTSGWKGAAVIPDLPVPGALEFLVGAMRCFDVHILSSRSNQWGGRGAMKRFLILELKGLAEVPEMTPKWWFSKIAETAFADPWEHEVDFAARGVVKNIKFPRHKPPALVTIDDRAITFTGKWPSMETLAAFKPWNHKDV